MDRQRCRMSPNMTSLHFLLNFDIKIKALFISCNLNSTISMTRILVISYYRQSEKLFANIIDFLFHTEFSYHLEFYV